MQNNVLLSDLITELTETVRNNTTGALDNSKRTRGINRTFQDLQNYADWKPTRRTVEFEYISGLSEYSLENYIGATCLDNDGATVIPDFKSPWDLRFKSNIHNDFTYREKDELLSHRRSGRNLNEYTEDGGILYVNYPGLAQAIVHNCDSLTALGSAAVSGSAANLTLDDTVYEEGSGAFNFDINGTAGVLTLTLTTPLNLETLENKAYLTFFLDLPTITNFTNVKVRFGSSATDYYEKTETTPASKAELATGRSKWAFSWADATATGTPDATAIDYVQITITYSAVNDTDFRVDDIRMSESETMELEYFSIAMVLTASGAYQLEFNADDVTMTDQLLDGQARLAVIAGGTYECFKMIGGKSERDRTDAQTEYTNQKKAYFKKSGYRLRRPLRELNFPGRH